VPACTYRELADYLNRERGSRNRAGSDLDRATCHTRRNRSRNNLEKQKQGDQPVKALCCNGGLGTAQPTRFGRDPGKGGAEDYQDLTSAAEIKGRFTSYVQNCLRCYACLKIGFLFVLIICSQEKPLLPSSKSISYFLRAAIKFLLLGTLAQTLSWMCLRDGRNKGLIDVGLVWLLLLIIGET